MPTNRIAACLIALVTMLSQAALAANLIRNGSFEQTGCVTPCDQYQSVLPAEWIGIGLSGDTYSNDGSYGLAPDAYGNFIGATAQDGIRWVAAWSYYPEMFGQVLTAPLAPGVSYTISAFLREATRSDLANPGTYQVELWDVATLDADKIVLGAFDLVANQAAWEQRTLTFTAPAQAGAHRVLVLRPMNSGTGNGNAYPGIDNISLAVTGASGGVCASANSGATIVINGCDTGVPNASTAGGTCTADLVLACGTTARSHGGYVNCVAHLTDSLVSLGTISGQQKGRIQSCVAHFGTP